MAYQSPHNSVTSSLPRLKQTARAEAVDYRTYHRPLDDEATRFETREQMIQRAVVDHHTRLWDGVNGSPDLQEIHDLAEIHRAGYGSIAGRTLWLGGTPYAYERAASQFNCSFTEVSTVFDVVDAAWLLLNGCGVGFKPVVGTLHGYHRPIRDFRVVPSTRTKDQKGPQENQEELPSSENNYTWTLRVGDSAASWARAIGKLIASPRGRTDSLVLDFSNVRGPGGRLKGYGWICNGSEPLARAMSAIHRILNRAAGHLLNEIEIMDVVNHLGTILSSRRAAEICLLDGHNPRVSEFRVAKRDYFICKDCDHWATPGGVCSRCGSTNNNQHRRQSNNTIMFWAKPTHRTIEELLYAADDCGGDPAICNAEAMLNKAPWAVGFNPCAEILLSKYGFCNLTSVCLSRVGNSFALLERVVYLLARANYRQTCVQLNDGVLQPQWNQTQEALRLCGLSCTGIMQAGWLTDYQIRQLHNVAVAGAYSMADELKRPRPKAVTCVKPEGTGTKTLGSTDFGDVTEGIHKPLGEFIFNWINFSVYDPLVSICESAGYRTLPNPSDPANVLVCFPVRYRGVQFDSVDGKRVNRDSAISQLNRYLKWNNLWADHQVSCTVSYGPEEIPAIARWLDENWDRGFIAVSFLRRTDPTKTAADLGHPYLPQEVVTEESYREYTSRLRPVSFESISGWHDLSESGCDRGVCPVR